MNLNKLAQTRVEQLTHAVTVDIDGETLNAVLRPGGVTPATQVRLANAPDPAHLKGAEELSELVRIMTRVLCEVVVSWDVEMDGETVPLTGEALEQLPGDVLSLLFTALMEQVSEGPKETSETLKPSTRRAVKPTKSSQKITPIS